MQESAQNSYSFFHSNYTNEDIKSDTLDFSNTDDDIRLMRMKLLESQQLSTAPPEPLLSVGNDGEEDLATLVIIIRLADTNTGCNDVTRRCSDSALIQIITEYKYFSSEMFHQHNVKSEGR